MKKKRTKRRVLVLGTLAVAGLLLLFTSGKRGFLQQFKVHRKKAVLEKEIGALNQEKKRLTSEKESLDSLETIERIAREKYGMAKENEKVYRVVPVEK